MFGIKQDGTYRVERIGFSTPTLTDGYVVAIRPIKREADIVTEGALFGRWTDDDGTVYWDEVEVLPSLLAAIQVAYLRNELAVWGIAEAKEYRVAAWYPGGPRVVLQHDDDGQAAEEHGNRYVEERVQRIPNQYGYGHHNEHPATTRSRALKRARAAFGPRAVIRANVGRVYLRVAGSDTVRARYAVVVPA